MKTKKITQAEASAFGVSSLPTRPNALPLHGGRGYTAEEMKAAFDRLPLLILERLNSLLDDISAVGEDSVLGAIKTGFDGDHSLYDLMCDIKNGNFASYLMLCEKSLYAEIAEIKERLCALEKENTSTKYFASSEGEVENEPT